MFRSLLVAVLGLLAVSAANAQTTGAATIVGTVTDTSGAVVPGAKVASSTPKRISSSQD